MKALVASNLASRFVPLLVLASSLACDTGAMSPEGQPSATSQTTAALQAPGSDELGMGRELGRTTWSRCAAHLTSPEAKVYELSYVRSNTMPLSPFAGPFEMTYLPTAGLPGSSQVFNLNVLNENAMNGQQGTQFDALGHFARLHEPWDGTSELPTAGAQYYGGFTQEDVKPTPDSPLLKLGMEKVPPIVTSAILLDARKHINGGEAMQAGELVTREHIEQILEAQGLSDRGILPGDAVFIYTGWSDHYQDPVGDSPYYAMAPGLSLDAARYLGELRVVAVGLDNWGVDAAADGQLAGTAPPPDGTPPDKPFVAHDHFLTQAGVYHLENLKLAELARDGVVTSCTMILPLLEKGSSGSPIRPVSIGTPAP